MRTRSTSSYDPNVTVVMKNWTSHASKTDPTHIIPTADTYSTYCPGSSVKTITDVVTDHWYARRNSGEVIVNPLTITTERWERTSIFIRREMYLGYTWYVDPGPVPLWGIGGGRSWEGYLAPTCLGTNFLGIPSLSIQSVMDEAVTGSWAKCSEQDAQGLVILAEGEKTIKSFISIAWRFINILRALKRWDVGWLSRQLTPKELADRWMEGRYAIRPVVYDAYDCIKAVNRNLKNNPPRRTYRSGASASGSATQSGLTVASFGADEYSLVGTKSTVREITARAGVLAAIDEVTASTSWGLNQPVTALWELVPFSFVVDWFFNVGKTIAAWSPHYGLRALASWVTVVDTVISSIIVDSAITTWSNTPTRYANTAYAHDGKVVKITSTKQRVIAPNRPILPTFTVRLDWAKFLDLAIMAKRLFR